MIRLLVSSKHLYKRLLEIKFSVDLVESVELIGKLLSIKTQHRTIAIYVEPLERCTTNKERQEDRNWRDIRDIVKNAPDQPIVLEISEKVTSVIFQI